MTASADDDYPVDVPPDVLRACCDAYDAAYRAELEARIVVPDDLTTHAEVRALLAVLPRLLRDELLRHVEAAFPDDEEVDGHVYALERLLESMMTRATALDRWVVARTRREEDPR